MWSLLLVGFFGLAGGVIVGGALVALLTVLDVIPRLAQLASGGRGAFLYELAMIMGAISAIWLDFGLSTSDGSIAGPWLAAIWGAFAGVFVGMLAAALTEVLNVLPILAKRIGLADVLAALLWAMAAGKVCGSLLGWTLLSQ